MSDGARSKMTSAVVGLGYWGPNLARNLAASEDFELTALCDLDPGRLDGAARLHPGALRYGNIETLLRSQTPGLLVVATPLASHYELARKGLEAGCHVLIEKPMTSSVSEARDLIDIARRVGRRIFVDHTFLFTDAVREIKRQIEAGNLGELFSIDSIRINLGLFQPDVDVIWDLAPHDLAIIQHVLNRAPCQVAAMGSSHNPRGLRDVAYLHLSYGNALSAHLHLSWLSPVKIRRMIFAGANRFLIYDDLDAHAKIKVYDHGVDFDVADLETRRDVLVSYRRGEMRTPTLPSSEALAVELQEIAMVLRGERAAIADGRDGLDVTRILAAASESLDRSGAPMSLEPA